jgi:hypothetical protein
MFKRREAKPPEVGSLCTIKEKVIDKLYELKKYKEHSASIKADEAETFIGTYFFKRNSAPNLDVLFADFELLYIVRKSVFTGFVEVEGLAVNNDHPNGAGLLHYFKSKKNRCFTVSEDSLNIATDDQAEAVISCIYNPSLNTRILKRISDLNLDNVFKGKAFR